MYDLKENETLIITNQKNGRTLDVSIYIATAWCNICNIRRTAESNMGGIRALTEVRKTLTIHHHTKHPNLPITD